MCIMMRLLLILLFMILETYAANYTWPLYPIASEALYGYDQAANKSFKSENIPDGVKTIKEDGINALLVPAGVEIDLGDFAGTCVSNPTLCKNFTVSFLFKTVTDHDKDAQDIKVLDSGVKDGEKYEYGWSFDVGSSADVMVSYGDSQIYSEQLMARNAWILMAFTFDFHLTFGTVLYQNGSRGNNPPAASNCYLQDKNTRLKLGSVTNTKGFFISNLKFIGMKLSDAEIQEYGNRSFEEAMKIHNITIEILQAKVIIQAEAGKAAITLRRRGFHGIATEIIYATASLTAKPSKHYKALTNQRLTFAPGEIYKHLEIEIINVDDSKGNKTFQVIFRSPQKHVQLTGGNQVNITIVYAKGDVQSQGAIVDGKLRYCLVAVMVNLFCSSFVMK
ncbi:uncharacterized protein LOC144657147 [Oculina patagonica]